MKKIFTLIAAALMAVSAQAFKDTWKSTATSTSPVSTANIKITFNDLVTVENDVEKTNTWKFSKDYAAGEANGQTVTIEPTASGNLTIIFGGSISTSKKLHMQDADGNGLTAKLASDETVKIEDNASPTADLAASDGVVYALEAGKVYTFSVSGTKWRFASYKYTDEAEIVYDTEWNFSTWDDESTGFSNQVKENLGLFACYQDEDPQITNFGKINGSNKGSYKKRFQLGGGGSPLESTGTPTRRFVYFNVKGNAYVSVQFLSGSSSEERTLSISDGTKVLSATSAGGNLTEAKATYTGGAGVIYIYGSAAINIYDIKATNVDTTVKLDDASKPTGIGVVKANAEDNGAAYNVAGQKVDEGYKGLVIKGGKKMIQK